MKTAKSLAAGLLIAACIMWLALNAHAAEDSMTLDLTITNVITVEITDGVGSAGDLTNYDFGDLVLGDVTVNSGGIGVNNESGGLLQTYQLSVIDGGDMTLRESAGALAKDEYRISALFQAAQPLSGDFLATGTNTDLVTTTNQTAQAPAADSSYSEENGSTDEDGVNVSDTGANAEIGLWLKLEAPPVGSTTQGFQDDFATIYVTAIAGS